MIFFYFFIFSLPDDLFTEQSAYQVKKICYFHHLQPAYGFWTWKRNWINIFLGYVKNLTTALENKENCITGHLARADLHTGVGLSWSAEKCRGERRVKGKVKRGKARQGKTRQRKARWGEARKGKKPWAIPLCLLMNPWHMLINALLFLAAYQVLQL